MVEKKLITQVKGQGATGSFKLLKAAVIKPKKVVKKVLKKITKKPAAKKLQLKRQQNHPVLQRKPQLRRLSNNQPRPTELHQLK